MDVAYQFHVVVIVVSAGYIIRFIIVIRSNVDNNKIGWLLRLEVPFWRILSVDLGRPR